MSTKYNILLMGPGSKFRYNAPVFAVYFLVCYDV